CVAPEPQLADPLGVHVMAGRSTTVPFMAGGACVAYNGTCSATGSSDSGQLTFSFSSANNLGANNGTATITAALSAGSGTYLVAFNVYNNATHYATDGASWVTVDPCVPWDCTGRCGNPSNGCGGTLSCSPCDPPPDPGCI